MIKLLSFLILLQACCTVVFGLTLPTSKQPKPFYSPLPCLREQNDLELSWVKKRHAFVPEVLKKYGYDAYLISQREYAEDTIFRSLVPSTTVFSARRRTIFLFHTRGNDTEVPNPLVLIDNTPQIWEDLRMALDKIGPKKIALNIDPDLAFGDGLHTGESRTLLSHLGPYYSSLTSSERMVPVEIIATRTGGEEQLSTYRGMMRLVWAMIEEGFSERVVKVGETTVEDLEWWFRSRMQSLNVTTWFHPTVTGFTSSGTTPRTLPLSRGTMLHVDIGITAMNMNTDTQHLGYILDEHETGAPKGLKEGLRRGNRMQDLVRDEMRLGRKGDEVLSGVRERMKGEEIEGLVYCHPIGDYGHSAGPVVGMTNLQRSVPVIGSLPFLPRTWFSVELSATHVVPEWNNLTQTFPLEEDVFWNEETGGWDWVYGRQEEFWLIRPEVVRECGDWIGRLRKVVSGLGWW